MKLAPSTTSVVQMSLNAGGFTAMQEESRLSSLNVSTDAYLAVSLILTTYVLVIVSSKTPANLVMSPLKNT